MNEPTENWEWIRDYFEYETWSDEQGIAIIVGLRPGQEQTRPEKRDFGYGLLGIENRLQALKDASSSAALLISERRAGYRKLYPIWQARKDREGRTPDDFIAFAVKNRKRIPWYDWAEENRLIKVAPVDTKAQNKLTHLQEDFIIGLLHAVGCGDLNDKGIPAKVHKILEKSNKPPIKVPSPESIENFLEMFARRATSKDRRNRNSG